MCLIKNFSQNFFIFIPFYGSCVMLYLVIRCASNNYGSLIYMITDERFFNSIMSCYSAEDIRNVVYSLCTRLDAYTDKKVIMLHIDASYSGVINAHINVSCNNITEQYYGSDVASHDVKSKLYDSCDSYNIGDHIILLYDATKFISKTVYGSERLKFLSIKRSKDILKNNLFSLMIDYNIIIADGINEWKRNND